MRIGLGCLTSFFLISCWLPLPLANIIEVKLINVWDAETFSTYEELHLRYQVASIVPISKVFLKNEIYTDLEVHLTPFIYQTVDKTFEGSEEGIRFSFYECRLPRGRYTLTLVGKAGQERSMIFYLEDTTFKGDWNELVTIDSGEIVLNPSIDWSSIEKKERTFYRGEKGKDILLIKGFPPRE